MSELGVATHGKTREEAKRNLREALLLHFEAMAEYAIQHGTRVKGDF
jgi:predicted RNase H-like HicB family nuclease